MSEITVTVTPEEVVEVEIPPDGKVEFRVHDGAIEQRTIGATLWSTVIRLDEIPVTQIDALNASLAAEIARATGAEQAVAANLAAEVPRAVAAEQALASDLAAETAARQNAITDEANARAAADTANANAIAAETARATGAEQAIASDLVAETNARQSGDAANSAAIADEVTARQSAITAEANARAAADTANANAIAAETARAIGAEQAIASDLATETARATGAEQTIAAGLAAETARATGVEQALASDLTTETTRATDAEQALAANLVAEVARATGAEQAVASDLATETAARIAGEVATANAITAEAAARASALNAESIQRADADGALQGQIDALHGQLESDLAAESSARAAGDAANSAAIADEATARAAADTVNADSVAAETARATGAEQTIANDLAAEVSARTDGDATNANAIAAETTRATAAEQALAASIAMETTARQNGDAANALALADEVIDRQDAVANEAAARTAADTANANSIAVETARATGAEQDLEDALAAETSARIAAVNTEASTRAANDALKANLAGANTFSGAQTAPAYVADAFQGTASRVVGVTNSRDLVASDNGKLLNVTGTNAVTLTWPSGLTSGWCGELANNTTGAGSLVLEPSGVTFNGGSDGVHIPRGAVARVSWLSSNAFTVQVQQARDEFLDLGRRMTWSNFFAGQTNGAGASTITAGELAANSGTAAASWARIPLIRNLDQFPAFLGGAIDCGPAVIDIAMVFTVSHNGPALGTACRLIVGDAGSGTPQTATQNALTGRGWGWETYTVTQPNKLTWSEEVWRWTQLNTITFSNVSLSPTGILAADKIAASGTSSGTHDASITGLTVASGLHAFSCYVKPGGHNYTELLISSDNAFTNFAAVQVNVADGSYIGTRTGGSYSVASYNIEPVAGGWYRITLVVNLTGNATHRINIKTAAVPTFPVYAGNGVDGILVWGAQLEAGSAATAYSEVMDSLSPVRLRCFAHDGTNYTAGTQVTTLQAGHAYSLLLRKIGAKVEVYTARLTGRLPTIPSVSCSGAPTFAQTAGQYVSLITTNDGTNIPAGPASARMKPSIVIDIIP